MVALRKLQGNESSTTCKYKYCNLLVCKFGSLTSIEIARIEDILERTEQTSEH